MRERAIRVLTNPRENWRAGVKVLVAIALILVLVPLIAHVQPWLVGADVSYVVQSGSMEPNISTGSVVFVETNVSIEQVEEGEVITFTKGRETRTTTHRVHEKKTATVDGETSYRLIMKGDANEDPDTEPVYRGDIVGRVLFSVPFVGFLIAFAGSDVGWLVLVGLPVLLLFADGLWTLYQAVETEGEA